MILEHDQDPLNEELRVDRHFAKDFQVKIHKLTKRYVRNYKAVNTLSFGLLPGECFALLGVTGAGKTSTFKCITGEELAEKGSMHICGYDVNTSKGWETARTLMGYCPQFDALFDGLTV